MHEKCKEIESAQQPAQPLSGKRWRMDLIQVCWIDYLHMQATGARPSKEW